MDDDDVPPLEDMSHEVKQLQSFQPKPYRPPKPEEPVLASAQSKSKPFGFQKGFLNQSRTPQKKAPRAIPIIKPKSNASDSLRFNEVQEAMKSQMSLLDKQEWMTPDFLSKIESDPALARALADPEFQQAATEMSTNPQAAFKKYSAPRYRHLLEALRMFAGLLGDTLGGMEPAATAADRS
ncbi:hypothetical protein HKX48_006552 [Thoreauomyces humboldtii]|nr:hypothetical protein HKX48_006552 [Thoreauomyces humboldtii]